MAAFKPNHFGKIALAGSEVLVAVEHKSTNMLKMETSGSRMVNQALQYTAKQMRQLTVIKEYGESFADLEQYFFLAER